MKLEARITELEFVPYDYVRVRGLAHSSYDYGKICGNGPEFNLGWFWRGEFPKEVKTCLLNVERDTIIDLQERGVIPKTWPDNLVAKIDDGVFTFELKKFVIHNAGWNISKEKSYVEIVVHSKMHNEGRELISKVRLNISKESNQRLFKILDENL